MNIAGVIDVARQEVLVYMAGMFFSLSKLEKIKAYVPPFNMSPEEEEEEKKKRVVLCVMNPIIRLLSCVGASGRHPKFPTDT